jgi:hypothetical protein
MLKQMTGSSLGLRRATYILFALPDTACTLRVGVAALSGRRGLKCVPAKWRYLLPPTWR